MVSIIMPVYNASLYLKQSILSIQNQTFSDFELLLINDHSTDCSHSICQEFARLDKRIILFDNTTSTHGPGLARNIGLKHANGQYIFFMDADDWIEPDLLQSIIQQFSETHADVIQFGFFYEYPEKSVKISPYYSTKTLSRNDIEANFITFWSHNRYSLWMYVFTKSIINDIHFEPTFSGEDISFVLDVLCSISSISYLSKPLYHYRISEGSISHKWIDNTIDCRCMIWEHEKQLFDSFNGSLPDTAYTELAISNYIWAIYHLCSKYCPLSYKEKTIQLKNAAERMQINIHRRKCSLKNHHGLERVKYAMVKFQLENLLLLLGPLFLRIIRKE